MDDCNANLLKSKAIGLVSTLAMVFLPLVGPLGIGRCRKVVDDVDRTIPSGSMPFGIGLFLFGVTSPFLLLGVDGVDGFFLFLAPFLLPLPAFADLRALCLFPIVAVSSSIVSSSIVRLFRSSLPVLPLPVGRLFQYCLFRSSLFRSSLPVLPLPVLSLPVSSVSSGRSSIPVSSVSSSIFQYRLSLPVDSSSIVSSGRLFRSSLPV